MSTEPKSFRRKQLIINKKFQVKIILKALVPLVAMIVVTGALVIFGLGKIEADFRFENTNELIVLLSGRLGEMFQSSAALFSDLQLYGLLLLGGLFICAGGYVVYVFLYFSHRIAGPILRFERTLEAVLNGNLRQKINLRDKDEFKETADHFNSMLSGLENRIKQIKALNEESLALLEAGGDNTRLKELAAGIQTAVAKFEVE